MIGTAVAPGVLPRGWWAPRRARALAVSGTGPEVHDRRSQGVAGSEARRLDPQRLGDHLDRLYRAAYGLCGNRADAEDLVQDTYARILARPRWLRHEDDLGYLLRALRHTWISGRRSASRRPAPSLLADVPEPQADPAASDPQVAVEVREVYRAVAGLPDGFREVVAAVDLAGLTYAEAATALGVPIGTVMSRLYRARGRLAHELGEPGSRA